MHGLETIVRLNREAAEKQLPTPTQEHILETLQLVAGREDVPLYCRMRAAESLRRVIADPDPRFPATPASYTPYGWYKEGQS